MLEAKGKLLTLVVLPLVHVLKVIDTGIVVVLPGEDDGVQIFRVGIRDRVTCNHLLRFGSFRISHQELTVGIPSAKACLLSVICAPANDLLTRTQLTHIEAPHEGDLRVH